MYKMMQYGLNGPNGRLVLGHAMAVYPQGRNTVLLKAPSVQK